MPSKSHPDPVPASLKSLAYFTFAIALSGASPIPQSISARELGSTSPNEDRMTTKNILDWLFVAAAVIIVGSIFIWRTRFLRSRDRPLQDFFSFIEAPQRGGGSSPGRTRPPSPGLTPIPLGRQRRGQTRGTDIDSEGRRGGEPDPDDVNGDRTGKDILPAYEVKGGPPNYSRFLAVDLGTGTNARLQVTETVPVEMSPQSQPPEAGSEVSNLPVQASPLPDIQLPTPPPPSYSPEMPTNHSDGPPPG